MALSLDDRARVYLYATVTITADPTSATAVLLLDPGSAGEVTVPLTWTEGAAADGSGAWTRRARTNQLVCGPNADDKTSAVVLAEGSHEAQVLVTMPDTQVIPATVSRLLVRT